MQSDQTLCCRLTNFNFHLDVPENNNGEFHKWKVDYSIEKFSRLMVYVTNLGTLPMFVNKKQ